MATLEGRLRDADHQVEPGGNRVDSSVPGYLWSFPLTVDVQPPTDEESDEASSDAPSAAKEAAP
jgi:hypothetical protein